MEKAIAEMQSSYADQLEAPAPRIQAQSVPAQAGTPQGREATRIHPVAAKVRGDRSGQTRIHPVAARVRGDRFGQTRIHPVAARVHRAKRRGHGARSGQTLILALAILFLMVVVAGIFVTMILRNLTRVTRQTTTDNALALAIAGLQHAAEQFRLSPDGADWRPQISEALWVTPNPPAGISVPCAGCPPSIDPGQTGALNAAELRLLDPDYQWLSDNSTFNNPYVRFSTGQGRFLLRVTYMPSFVPASASSTGPDIFDTNSSWVHIESIGRPGDFDPNDPSFFTQDATSGTANSLNRFRKVDAYVPLGLVDQLWWVTNQTGENGPANLGIPPYQDGNGNQVQYTTLLQGGIRVNADVQFNGNVVIRVIPSRGEDIETSGNILMGPVDKTANGPAQQVTAQVMQDLKNQAPLTPPSVQPDNQGADPTQESLIATGTIVASQSPGFSNLALPDSGEDVHPIVLDAAHLKSEANISLPNEASRAATIKMAPPLDQTSPETGVLRWLQLTRDSGATISVTDSTGATHVANSGQYGWIDQSIPTAARAEGLYIDNFDDIQYPRNRPAVKDEWLRREPTHLGWEGDSYLPTIGATQDHPLRAKPTPIVDIFFTQQTDPASGQLVPAIQVTRFDPDVRQVNLSPNPQPNEPRQFYMLQGAAANGSGGTAVPLGITRTFPVPQNGVIYAEGSIRVHGTYGTAGANLLPIPLTVVSGGTIYIDGSLQQFRGGQNPVSAASPWQIALLAMDNIVPNPTAGGTSPLITDYSPGVLPPSGQSPLPGQIPYYDMPPGGDLNFISRPALDALAALPAANPLILLLKHTGKFEDNLSTTHVSLGLPGGNAANPFNVFNWESALPPGFQAAGHPNYYLFHFISAGAPLTWDESNYQSPNVPPSVWEQKAFGPVDPGGVGPAPGFELSWQIRAGTDTTPDEQDYMLAKLALVPAFGYDGNGNVNSGTPLAVRIEATMYAYHGCWFVIPPPFYNDNVADAADTRAAYYAADHQRSVNGGVYPSGSNEDVPFYHEPLNMDLQVLGSITENMPTDQSDQAAWVKQVWNSPTLLVDPNNPASQQWAAYDYTQPPGATGQPTPPPFEPNLRYLYDSDYRRLVRVRVVQPYVMGPTLHSEEVAWVAPGAARGGNIRSLATIQAEARANNSYVQTLPLFPKLPASAVLYEGSAF